MYCTYIDRDSLAQYHIILHIAEKGYKSQSQGLVRPPPSSPKLVNCIVMSHLLIHPIVLTISSIASLKPYLSGTGQGTIV